MKITNEDSFAVEFIACLSSDQLRRRLISARISAPVAPIAPPSVGVAMPRKIVPSTRKISASGGISTNNTRRSSFAPAQRARLGRQRRRGVGVEHRAAEHVERRTGRSAPGPE